MAGVAAPASFRANWQQMVAALDNSADEDSSAAAEAFTPQTFAANRPSSSSSLQGNRPRIDTASQALAETFEPAITKPAQASTASAHAASFSEQEAGPESADEADSGAASVRAHSERAKSSHADRPAATKPTHLPASPPSLNDAATTIAAQVLQPVQPARLVKAPVDSGQHLPTLNPSNLDVGAHPAIATAGQGVRVWSPEAARPLPNTNLSVENEDAQSRETPDSVAGGGSASHSAIANHAPEATVQPPAASAVSPASSSQPGASQKDVSQEVPTEASAASAADIGVVSSASSGYVAELARQQIAAGRAASGSQTARVDHTGDSSLNPAAVEIIHSQLNGATAGSAVVRDVASALPANSSSAAGVQTGPGNSTQETFTALDGAGNSMHPTWIHAGPHQAEAGFEDPALGWVSVRAGVNAGGISAVVVPGSADATQALGAHMAGLHDYLAEQHSPVATLTMATAQNPGSDTGPGQGAQHDGMQQQGQQQSGEDNRGNAQSLSSVAPTATASAHTAHGSSSESPAILSGSGARYISVMA